MISLVAEPLTGVVDTAYVARLGAAPLAALGVATTLLSGVFWIFNFLGIGTQTEVAHAFGTPGETNSRDAAGLAMALGALFGVGLALIGWPLLDPAARFMSDDAEIRSVAVTYLEIRLLGGPAILLTIAAFGALRGLQDMRTPLRIAVVANAVNVVLDAVLIFGLGPVPAFGIAGAAWASVASQWLGAAWAFAAVRRRLGLPARVPWSDASALLVVGRDMFTRTGLLLLFIVLATRTATRIGADAGAAHQAIRQIWLLTALVLDAYAATAQSLVAYFLGANHVHLARRVARVSCLWGLGTGSAIALAMLLGREGVELLLVPTSARAVFAGAWSVAAFAQPLNALSFVTDGIHWGTRDYRYLRNGMLASSGLGALALAAVDPASEGALIGVWLATSGWIAVRALFGVARVWPGLGAAPLAPSSVGGHPGGG